MRSTSHEALFQSNFSKELRPRILHFNYFNTWEFFCAAQSAFRTLRCRPKISESLFILGHIQTHASQWAKGDAKFTEQSQLLVIIQLGEASIWTTEKCNNFIYWNNINVLSSYYISWTFIYILIEEKLHIWNVYIVHIQIKIMCSESSIWTN